MPSTLPSSGRPGTFGVGRSSKVSEADVTVFPLDAKLAGIRCSRWWTACDSSDWGRIKFLTASTKEALMARHQEKRMEPMVDPKDRFQSPDDGRGAWKYVVAAGTAAMIAG